MADVNKMNMTELDEAIKSGTLTESEEKQARDRLDDLSNRGNTSEQDKEDIIEDVQRRDYQEGRQSLAHGGKACRGRKAAQSAETTG